MVGKFTRPERKIYILSSQCLKNWSIQIYILHEEFHELREFMSIRQTKLEPFVSSSERKRPETLLKQYLNVTRTLIDPMQLQEEGTGRGCLDHMKTKPCMQASIGEKKNHDPLLIHAKRKMSGQKKRKKSVDQIEHQLSSLMCRVALI